MLNSSEINHYTKLTDTKKVKNCLKIRKKVFLYILVSLDHLICLFKTGLFCLHMLSLKKVEVQIKSWVNQFLKVFKNDIKN